MRRHELRPITEADHTAVLELVNADRIPGQPVATAGMLADAAADCSSVDGGWWAELSEVRVDVLTDTTLGLLGVVSYGHRPRDRAGIIVWVHALEDPGIVAELIQHAVSRLAEHPVVEAFGFATPFGRGLDALPVWHRPVTDHALRGAGFVGAGPASDRSRAGANRLYDSVGFVEADRLCSYRLTR
jgi:hypothetical protein